MILMALSIAQLHLLAQDAENEVQHYFFSHVKPLALVLSSHDADSIVNITMAFLRSRQSK